MALSASEREAARWERDRDGGEMGASPSRRPAAGKCRIGKCRIGECRIGKCRMVRVSPSRMTAAGQGSVREVSGRCQGSVSEVSGKCLGSVSEVSRKCQGSVSEPVTTASRCWARDRTRDHRHTVSCRLPMQELSAGSSDPPPASFWAPARWNHQVGRRPASCSPACRDPNYEQRQWSGTRG